MKYRNRTYYTEEQKSEMWDRWQKGDSLHDIARLFDRHHSSIQRIIREREEISRGISAQLSIRAIAAQINRSPSTISHEINRNGGLL